MTSSTTLLEKLDNKLEQISRKTKFVYHSSEINDRSTLVEAMDSLNNGFVCILDAISEDSISQASANIAESIVEMWENVLSEKDKAKLLEGDLSAIDKYRNPKNGFGNASFGYLYKQFIPSDQMPSMTLENQKVYFDINCAYYKVLIPLLTHPDNFHSTAVLLALTHPTGFLSWDSVKVSVYPKPKPKSMTKPTLTEMHFDSYDDDLERYQAIDNNDTGSIKLFFVPGSSNPKITRLIAKIIGNTRLYDGYGFCRIPKECTDLISILHKHSYAPPPRARVVWGSKTIHFEGRANTTPLGPDSPYHRMYSFRDLKDEQCQQRLRFVIGTQKLIGLSEGTKIRLAAAASVGMLPAVYNRVNAGTKVHTNIVNSKTTRWLIPRELSDNEKKDLFERIEMVNNITTRERLSEIIPDPLTRHLLGISSPLRKLGFSEKDIALFILDQ